MYKKLMRTVLSITEHHGQCTLFIGFISTNLKSNIGTGFPPIYTMYKRTLVAIQAAHIVIQDQYHADIMPRTPSYQPSTHLGPFTYMH